MKKIQVDFNYLTEKGLVVVPHKSIPDSLEGEEVILHDEEMEVPGFLHYDERWGWVACALWTRMREGSK